VVLPFANLSGDTSQDYFADGMVEDITIALGRLPWLFVIGSIAAFTYKNRPIDLRTIGDTLGVRYVLRGSVRKDGDRVRITAELTDAIHSRHIWADRFESEIDSVFELQDRVAMHVSAAIAPALQNQEIERARRVPTENLTAYDLFLQALPGHTDSLEQNLRSIALLQRAIEIDPTYSVACGLSAWCHAWQKMMGWVPPDDPSLAQAIPLAHRAAELGANDSEAMWMAAQALTLVAGELDTAIVLADKSLALNPNAPNAWWARGVASIYFGGKRADEGLDYHQSAGRLNPVDPWAYYYSMGTAAAHFFAGRYAEAVAAADVPLGREPSFVPALRLKAAAYGLLNMPDDGRLYVERLLAASPNSTVDRMRRHYEGPLRQNPQGLELYLEGLRRSGLLEGS
jgi:TolB-like protein